MAKDNEKPQVAEPKRIFKYFRMENGKRIPVEYDTNRFRITQPRYYQSPGDPFPQFIDASLERPAIIEVAEGTKIDEGMQPATVPYLKPKVPHVDQRTGLNLPRPVEFEEVQGEPAPQASGRASDMEF